jgi:phosphatidate cytidylyltransferase
MTSFQKRLVTVLVGVPAVLLVVFGLPQYNHLAFAIGATIFAFMGSREMANIIEKKSKLKINFPFYLGALLPISQWIAIRYDIPGLTNLCLIFLILFSFGKEIFDGTKEIKPFEHSLEKIAYDTLVIIYPNFLVSFVISFSIFNNASSLYAMFFILVFTNDIFAYVFGIAFGRTTTGVFQVSPNKSLVGFIGGILSSIGFGVICFFIVPTISSTISLFATIILSFLVAIAANIGDLIESAIKRSSEVKDSGDIIPGRGGALDSLDSILTAAPVFYILIQIFGM